MKRRFTASIWREGEWDLAQCMEVDVTSQGESEEEALSVRCTASPSTWPR